MKPAEIIAMAREAGIQANVGYIIGGEHKPAVSALKTSVPVEWLERFAALVAAKAAADEREAIRIALSAEAGGCELWPDEIDAVLRARSPQ